MVSEGNTIDIDCPNGCESDIIVTAVAPTNKNEREAVSLTCEMCQSRIERCENCGSWTTPESGHETAKGDIDGVIDVLVFSDC